MRTGRCLRRYVLPLLLLALGAYGWHAGAHVPGAPLVIPGLVPHSVAVSPNGTLFLIDHRPPSTRDRAGSASLWRISGSRVMSRLFGPGHAVRNDGPVPGSAFGAVGGVACDAAGDLFLWGMRDSAHIGVWKLDRGGALSHLPFQEPVSLKPLWVPFDGVDVAKDGSVLFVDTPRNRVLRADGAGRVSIVVTGTPVSTKRPRPGIIALALSEAGDLFVAVPSDGSVCRLDAGALVPVAGVAPSPVAGSATPVYLASPLPSVGDGGLGTRARLGWPVGLAAGSGQLYIADQGSRRVRKLDARGIITTVAGQGALTGDGGPARMAVLNAPVSVACGPDSGLYIADWGTGAVRKVDCRGLISTVASRHGRLDPR